jgi:nucleotide-binding universal stress UspA family protein
MLEVKRILCPVDFSEFSIRAFRHALSLAEHYRAGLIAQHVVELWRHPESSFAASAQLYDEFCESLRAGGREQLQEFAKNHSHNEVKTDLIVSDGMAPDAILSVAQEQKAELIVMGTHGLRGFDRLMLGSVTERVMRRSVCPVQVVRELPRDLAAAGQEQPYIHRLDRVLACTDFSADSERALDYAISAAAEYDAELTLLHVLERNPGSKHTEQAIADATAQLEKVLPPETRKSVKVKTAVRIGKPYEQIIQFAQDAQIDVVMMGVRGRGALDLAIFGSTAYRVMQLGPCPVLTAHV